MWSRTAESGSQDGASTRFEFHGPRSITTLVPGCSPPPNKDGQITLSCSSGKSLTKVSSRSAKEPATEFLRIGRCRKRMITWPTLSLHHEETLEQVINANHAVFPLCLGKSCSFPQIPPRSSPPAAVEMMLGLLAQQSSTDESRKLALLSGGHELTDAK